MRERTRPPSSRERAPGPLAQPLGAWAVLLLVCAAFAAPPAALAQGVFGKNKIQYEARDWRVLRTPHAEIFYYSEEESLAREVAVLAESTCAAFDTTFQLELTSPIPILLYASHQDFQQTNAAQGFISEGVGGLTELIKGRVLIPHVGSRHRLAWVTRHELVHAYMLIKLGRVMKEKKNFRMHMPPLWFIEGLAEFLSTQWDSQAEGLLRDAVVSNQAYPVTESYPITGTVLMYKEGQSFLDFLAKRHSRRHVLDILENWWRGDSFEAVFEFVFGEPLATLDREWFAELKRRYYPAIATRFYTEEQARTLTDGLSFNLAPTVFDAPSDSGYRYFYLSAREGAVSLMLGTVEGAKIRSKRLLRGGYSSKFESLHLFRTQLGVSRHGLVALVAQRGGRDVLHVYDALARRLLHTWSIPGVTALASPTWLAGDSLIVVSGQREGGQVDLFRVRVADGQASALTDDPFEEQDPSAHPSRRRVVYSCDRDGGERGFHHLYELDLETGARRRLTSGAWSDRDPEWSPDGGRLAFRSDRSGTDDLYLWRPSAAAESGPGAEWLEWSGAVDRSEPGEVRRLTRLLGTAQDPSWLPDGRGLLFASQSRLTYHVYEMPVPSDEEGWQPESTGAGLLAWPAAERWEGESGDYRPRFGIDIAQNGVALDPTLGAAGAGQIALSDMLGNQVVYFYLSNDAEDLGSFLDGMEVGATYFNQSRRMNYGAGLFRLTRLYDVRLDVVRRERRVGGLLLASYPISKFERIEGSFVLRYAQDHLVQGSRFLDVWLASNFLSYIRDNVRWTEAGATDGMRWNLSGGYTRDLTTGSGDFFTLAADTRIYREPAPRVISATRVLAQLSFGDDPQLYYLGGRFDLRGHPRRSLIGTRALLAQQEFRFPLLRRLQLGFPAAWEFPPIQGALFYDFALAGEPGRRSETRGTLGAGMFIGGGYFPALRLDFYRNYANGRPLEGVESSFRLIFNF